MLADLLEDDGEDDDTDGVSFNDRLSEDKKALRREREEDSWLVIKEKKEMVGLSVQGGGGGGPELMGWGGGDVGV